MLNKHSEQLNTAQGVHDKLEYFVQRKDEATMNNDIYQKKSITIDVIILKRHFCILHHVSLYFCCVLSVTCNFFMTQKFPPKENYFLSG